LGVEETESWGREREGTIKNNIVAEKGYLVKPE